jgi:nitrate reductase NapD
MADPERLSRRDVLTGRIAGPPAPEAHISSLVVHVRPERAETVRAALAAFPGVEIHGEGGGKIVLTLETESEAEIVSRLNEISLLEGVMSAALVFHHFETAVEERSAAKRG